MLIICPECGKEISSEAKACPNCGYEIKKANFSNRINISQKQTSSKRNIIILIIVLICCVGIGMYILANNFWKIDNVNNCLQNGKISCLFVHEWVDKDCENPKQCDVCGLTDGEAAGHKWIEATCEKAKYCETCNAIDGKPLGHTTRQGYCGNCNNYMNELQDIYDYLVETIDEAWLLIDETMKVIQLTDSFYDTTYVAKSNEINYKIQDLLYDASDVGIKYEEFVDLSGDLRMAGAKLMLFDNLTSDTGFGSYTYMTSIVNSIADCATLMGEAQEKLAKYAE